MFYNLPIFDEFHTIFDFDFMIYKRIFCYLQEFIGKGGREWTTFEASLKF